MRTEFEVVTFQVWQNQISHHVDFFDSEADALAFARPYCLSPEVLHGQRMSAVAGITERRVSEDDEEGPVLDWFDPFDVLGINEELVILSAEIEDLEEVRFWAMSDGPEHTYNEACERIAAKKEEAGKILFSTVWQWGRGGEE